MPHAGDDLASADEVKVYKDEGDEEQRSSENLSEDKIGLVTETEDVKTLELERGDDARSTASAAGSNHSFLELPSAATPFAGSYPWISPYPYHNAAAAAAMAGLAGRLPSPHPAAGLGFYLYGGGAPSGDHLSQPPPAHMGIPPLHLDHKTGLPRPSLYPLPPPSNPLLYPFYTPDFSKCWSSLAGYPLTSAAFPTPYPTLSGSPLSPFGTTSGLFPPPPPPPHSPGGRSRQPSGLSSASPGRGHPDFFHMPGLLDSPRQRLMMAHRRSEYGSTGVPSPPEPPASQRAPRRPVIKKPLNAFMLFMKEMRQKVIDECTLKESAAINQILGRKWHALDKAEQAKYYEMARKEKELHMQLYPGWSARDNYGMHSKKKRKLRDGQDMKKCHPRFDSDHQSSSWCLSRSDSDSEGCSSVSLKANGADTSILTTSDL